MSAENIKTFAVLDIKTNGLPSEHLSKDFITELSVCDFSAKILEDKDDEIQSFGKKPPKLPRELHKFTLMIKPEKCINSEVERKTELGNEMLCNEAPFDTNKEDCLRLFLERLAKPICLVAHNGWTFDYPIIRHVLEKLEKSLPSSIFCVNSYEAFRDIDEKKVQIENATKVHMENEDAVSSLKQDVLAKITKTLTAIPRNNLINWLDISTLTTLATPHGKKRNLSTIINEEECYSSSSSSPYPSAKHKRLDSLHVRRYIFSDNVTPIREYPDKDVYKLGNIYERIFKLPAENLHHAESDVQILTNLILHYGLDFLAYAEERKQSSKIR